LARKLGDLLIGNGLITPDQLDQALQAQLVFGGRLGTNLVELGFLSTNTLAEFLARQLGLPALRPSQLNQLAPDVLETIDPKTAERHMLVPLSVEKRTLHVAMADPTDLSAVDEIAFRTGLRVIPVVAPELLVIWALEKFYGVRRANRYLRIAADPTGESEAREQPEPVADAAAPERGFDLRAAAAELADARKNAAVMRVLGRYLAQDFERVALLVVDDERLRGWSQSGCSLPREVLREAAKEPIHALEVDLTRSVLCRAASHSERPSVESVPPGEGDRLLVALLEPRPQEGILVFPVRVGTRVEAVALACRERRSGVLEETERHALFASKVTAAFEIVRLRKSVLSV
jgi:hypothetical protein